MPGQYLQSVVCCHSSHTSWPNGQCNSETGVRRVDLAGLSRGPWWIYICLRTFGCWAVVRDARQKIEYFEHRDSNDIPWIPVGIANIPDDVHRLCPSVIGTKIKASS